MTMSNKVYDVLRAIATIILPALGTLYAALAVIWGLPFPDQVTGTVLAIVTLLQSSHRECDVVAGSGPSKPTTTSQPSGMSDNTVTNADERRVDSSNVFLT